MRSRSNSRHGATAVEFAFVAPVALVILLGLIIGGMAVFRFQEIATLAREAARYASVHGAMYAQEQNQPAATPQSIYDNVIVPKEVILDLSQLTYSVTWNTDNRPLRPGLDANGQPTTFVNTVTVTINYNWLPEAFFGGGSTMTSSSTQIITY